MNIPIANLTFERAIRDLLTSSNLSSRYVVASSRLVARRESCARNDADMPGVSWDCSTLALLEALLAL